MKFVISSHIDYISTTEKPIFDSLIKAGIDVNDIYIFVGGYDVKHGYQKLDENINKYSAPHNSMDYTGLISVLEMNIQSDFWFLLHDTCYVGPGFYNTIKHYNHFGKDYVALTFDTSMNMGSFSWDYLQTKKNQILAYKNTDSDLQAYKCKLINEEDYFLKPKTNYYCDQRRTTKGPEDYYNNNTQRIMEYFPKIDLYKIKANWSIKPIYEIKL